MGEQRRSMWAAIWGFNVMPTDHRHAIENRERNMTTGNAVALFAIMLLGFGPKLWGLRQEGHPSLEIMAVEPNSAVTTPGTRVRVYGTGFSPSSVVYFGGIQCREAMFVGPTTLEAVTPYLRPGQYELQVKSGDQVSLSQVKFSAASAPVDSEISKAINAAAEGNAVSAIQVLTAISKNYQDYQVRAFAHYEMGEIYFSQGDWWRWGAESGGIFEPDAGAAVQTFWRYRLSYARSTYLLPIDSDPQTAVKLSDWVVDFDVTHNPEPVFFRALLNARHGNLQKAKTDIDWLTRVAPENQSYRALSAYAAVLGGDTKKLRYPSVQDISDPRALEILGEAAYLSGEPNAAQNWWSKAATADSIGGRLACLAGKRHLDWGEGPIGASLLAECIAMAPNAREAKQAKELLESLQVPKL